MIDWASYNRQKTVRVQVSHAYNIESKTDIPLFKHISTDKGPRRNLRDRPLKIGGGHTSVQHLNATSHTSVIVCVAETRDAIALARNGSFMALRGARAKAINTCALPGRSSSGRFVQSRRPILPFLRAWRSCKVVKVVYLIWVSEATATNPRAAGAAWTTARNRQWRSQAVQSEQKFLGP
jgi:hypothetical protein